jgi:3D (Asp-Asp-Asp) domain-containing protein
MPAMSAAAWKPWLTHARRLLRWWFAGLDRRGWFAGLRLLVTGLGIGLLIGVTSARYYRLILLQEYTLPRPVVDPPPGLRWVKVRTTGYCPCAICCGVFSDGRTSINRPVATFPFGIAVEPKLVPYRTQVDVPGYGLAMVDDTGGAMRQDAARGIVHFDLRFTTHGQARSWGVRSMYVALPAGCPAAQLPEAP